MTIVVLQADGCKFGLVIDEVNNTEEIVVKSLAKQLRGISIFSGATVMGDGRVALILDVPGLATHANVLSGVRSAKPGVKGTSLQESAEEKRIPLIFADVEDARIAIPLSQVTRLETFPRSSLERLGDQDVVQHRGQILPLVKISELLVERRSHPRGLPREHQAGEAIQAITCFKDGHALGLVVDKILDAIEYSPADLRPASREGVLACAVIDGRITEILDVDVLCAGLASVPQQQIPVEMKV